MGEKKRYALIGVGDRSIMYTDALGIEYQNTCELAAVCDINPGRVASRVKWGKENGVEIKGYLADNFEKMIREIRPDCVVVTTIDRTHDDYICRAMEMGVDVISEKPMTTTAEKCQRILETQRRTGRSLRVVFNYRYALFRTQVKDLLMSGVIGEVKSLDFHWLLDTRHGADYFRRWQRNNINSGGLLVHKSTHHFDLVNWWLSAVPLSVFATGDRVYYLPEQGNKLGLLKRSERCFNCLEANTCPFYLDLRHSEKHRSLYLENEHYDGYYRDRCVFSELIDIEDTMSVQVVYSSGATMTYSLNAFMPWEGYVINFNGTKGRLEHVAQETAYISGDGTTPGGVIKDATSIRIFPHFKHGYSVPIWTSEGGHGGGDPGLLHNLFSGMVEPDKYLRSADQRSGAYSILTGIAANQSIKTKQIVNISTLVNGLEMPDFTMMPGR